MTIKQQLDEAVDGWNLLNSKFYQAWNEGKLPELALAAYAEEYGSFIEMLPRGWEVLGDQETVQEEIEHTELWEQFAASFDTQVGQAVVPEVNTLLEVAEKLFGAPVTSLGAMYSFESQQPETAKTKLEGLRKHYSVSESAEEYFIVHSANHHESEKLLDAIGSLSAEEQQTALAACTDMSKALWDALEGIYETYCGAQMEAQSA